MLKELSEKIGKISYHYTWLLRNFPFRKQAMPFSQHLENFLTLNQIFLY